MFLTYLFGRYLKSHMIMRFYIISIDLILSLLSFVTCVIDITLNSPKSLDHICGLLSDN